MSECALSMVFCGQNSFNFCIKYLRQHWINMLPIWGTAFCGKHYGVQKYATHRKACLSGSVLNWKHIDSILTQMLCIRMSHTRFVSVYCMLLNSIYNIHPQIKYMPYYFCNPFVVVIFLSGKLFSMGVVLHKLYVH